MTRSRRSHGRAPQVDKILVAEDESWLRELYSLALSTRDLDVDASPDGVHALKRILKKRYDLLLLDLRMPFLGGLELLSEIRKRGVFTRVIVCTADLNSNTFLQAARLGVVSFLSKPLTIARLRHSVTSSLTEFSDVVCGKAFLAASRLDFAKASDLIGEPTDWPPRMKLGLWQSLFDGIHGGLDDNALRGIARELINSEIPPVFPTNDNSVISQGLVSKPEDRRS